MTLTPVPVRVVDASNSSSSADDRCRVSLTCSAGFYVRALVRDLGERCGTGACLEALRRTRSGDFTLDEAMTSTRSDPCGSHESSNPGTRIPDRLEPC